MAIRFLAKFVSQIEHAYVLASGQLFMYPAGYYQHLKKDESKEHQQTVGIYDLHEAAVSPTSMIFRGCDRSIFCMYAVLENDIHDGIISFNGKAVDDFCISETGYIVLCEYEQFSNWLGEGWKTSYIIPGDACNNEIKWKNDLKIRNIYAMSHGMVAYRNLTLDDMDRFLVENDVEPLFVKRPRFRHQQEYRIVIWNSNEERAHIEIVDNIDVCVSDGYNPILVEFRTTIEKFSHIYRRSDLVPNGSSYYLKIPE